jgi:hypothetical protein
MPVWEYQVEQFGSALKGAKTEDVERFLNEAASQGWELSHTAPMANGTKLFIVIRRKMEGRSRRRPTSFP